MCPTRTLGEAFSLLMSDTLCQHVESFQQVSLRIFLLFLPCPNLYVPDHSSLRQCVISTCNSITQGTKEGVSSVKRARKSTRYCSDSLAVAMLGASGSESRESAIGADSPALVVSVSVCTNESVHVRLITLDSREAALACKLHAMPRMTQRWFPSAVARSAGVLGVH